MRCRRLAAVAVAALAVAAIGCRKETGEEEKTFSGAPVVLISIDTLRSDHLPMYGYDGVETPALDALRADGILFERIYSHYPLTFPSHSSILTGKLPAELGIRDNIGYRLDAATEPYLPRLLREVGYRTAAAVSSYALRGGLGLATGFELYDDDMEVEDTAILWGPERPGDHTLKAALKWLETVEDEPFFLFLHLYEPHQPLTPPEPFLTRWGKSYEAEIAAADAVVGQLLDVLRRRGLYDDALVVFLSDHGEGLQDHGEPGHGIFLYRTTLQVPLVIKLPGNERAGESASNPGRLVDVAPTVTGLLGLEVAQEVTGRSLLELLEPSPPPREIYSETMYPRLHYGWSDLASMILGRFQYIEGPNPELYDLVADPGQEHNVLRDERATLADLRKRIRPYRLPLQLPAEESPEVAERLAALGYLSTGPVATESGPLPDPKLELALRRGRMDETSALISDGRFEEAIPILEELVEVNPMMTDAWEHLGNCLRETGRYEESLTAFEQALQLTRGSAQVAFMMGKVLVRLDRIDEAHRLQELTAESDAKKGRELALEIALAEGDLGTALQLAEAPAEIRPSVDARRRLALALAGVGRRAEALRLLAAASEESESPAVRVANALVLAETGQLATASEIVEGVLSEAPDSPMAWETRGLIALRQERAGEARDALEKALDLKEELPNSWNLLGVTRFQLGDAEGALAAWERAVELDPTQLDALYNLGLTAARIGRRDTARRALRRYLEVAPPERLGRERAQVQELLAQMGTG